MESLSVVALGEAELLPYAEEATRRIGAITVEAPAEESTPDGGDTRLGTRRIAYRPLRSVHSTPAHPERDLAERLQAIQPQDALFTDVEHHTLRLIRRAVQVALRLHRDYAQASGLDRLQARNRAGELAARDEAELHEKAETAGAVAVFALARFLLARVEEPAETPVPELAAPPALTLSGKTAALDGALAHLYACVDAHARDDASLLASVRAAAHGLALRIQELRDSLQYVEFYARYHYRVDPDDVQIAGFELGPAPTRAALPVPEKRPEEVVGNHLAKLEAERIAQRLACYDATRQANPFVDLGGFVFTFIGDGSPGTGKTTLIQMIVTLLRDYTEVADLALRYENFSVDAISDYQGRSGQNAKRFCQAVLDPRGVGFGTIDDVDQVCGNRNDRNASAGQLEVTAVFMQEFAGAHTVVRGNASFGLFSNHPDRVDDALRQRTQARFQIDGPRSADDYTDLFHIFLGDEIELPPGGGWEPLAAQRVREHAGEKYAAHREPETPALREALERVLQEHGGGDTPASWRAFGAYLHALHQADPSFTGRAVKNVSDAVRARRMDFDLPRAWLEDRSAFFAMPYETRVAMVRELRGPLTPGVLLEEIHRYAESESRYGESAAARQLESRTQEILLEQRAREAAARKS